MLTLTRYTLRASTILALGGTGRSDALWSDQLREEKHRLEESVCSLMLQQDTYLQEIHATSTSLTGSPLSFPGSFTDHVTFLVRGVARKDKFLPSVRDTLTFTQASLSAAQIEMEVKYL